MGGPPQGPRPTRPSPPGPRAPWRGRRIVLGVTGGIAAYKSVQLARDLTALGAEVDVVLTRSAERFVGALSFEGVTGRPVTDSLWSAEGAARHIRMAREADVVVVAPATADLMARAAGGRANDLLTAVLLATRAPVLIAPAMNDRMWSHPLTRRNAETLAATAAYRLVGPAEGPLAAGEGEGPGRMVEPEELVTRVGLVLGREAEWAVRRVVVTAGGTREAIDPVRFVGNRSSGRMGFAIATEAALRGAEVTLVAGPGDLPDPVGVQVVRVESALEMLAATREAVPDADVVVYAAAVADYRPSSSSETKTRKEDAGDSIVVELTQNPDIARETRELRAPDALAVGFALETEELVARASRKLEAKGFDLVVANAAGEEDAGFEVATNRVTVLDRGGRIDEWPLLDKDEVARRLLDRIGELRGDARRSTEEG